MGLQDSSWNISVSSSVVLAASVFEISCGETDRQTHRQTEVKTPSPRQPSAWVITGKTTAASSILSTDTTHETGDCYRHAVLISWHGKDPRRHLNGFMIIWWQSVRKQISRSSSTSSDGLTAGKEPAKGGNDEQQMQTHKKLGLIS